jgi:hypothetical protein
MPTVTVCYFNHRERQPERRSQEVADLCRQTIEKLVDLFEGQVGTVFSVYAGEHRLYRSAAQLSDLI